MGGCGDVPPGGEPRLCQSEQGSVGELADPLLHPVDGAGARDNALQLRDRLTEQRDERQ